jgi:hypothetical protein
MKYEAGVGDALEFHGWWLVIRFCQKAKRFHALLLGRFRSAKRTAAFY